jgi:ABC-2 type transport system ATP-binding protein
VGAVARVGPVTDCALRVTGLTKRYGDVLAVDHLDLEVRHGEILGFLGPNSAGKTTAMRMMCGLLRPDAGHIEIDGRPLLPGGSQSLPTVGVSPQEIVIWETLTCLEQLEFMGRMYGLSRSTARARSLHLLEALELTEKAGRLGRTLSGGMQRRLNIALGLVHEPGILFLDEPQAGLDPQSRVLVRDYVQSLRGRMTVIITTHDMEEAEKLADRVCIIDHGRRLVLDTVDGVKRHAGEADRFEIELEAPPPAALRESLTALLRPGEELGVEDRLLSIASGRGAVLVPELLRVLQDGAQGVRELRLRKTTLEDVFLRLTGRGLRS